MKLFIHICFSLLKCTCLSGGQGILCSPTWFSLVDFLGIKSPKQQLKDWWINTRTAGIMLLQRILGEVKYFCVSVEKRWLKWLYFKAVCGRSENHCCSHMHRPLGCSELTTAAPPVGKSQESQNSSSLHQKSDCHTDTNQTHMFWLPLSITFEMCSAQLMVTDITDAHHGCISVCTPEGLCCWCSLNE